MFKKTSLIGSSPRLPPNFSLIYVRYPYKLVAHPKISGTLYGGYNYHSTIVQLYTPSSILTHLIYGTVWLKFQKRYVKRSPSVTWEYLSSERIFDKVNFNALANAWNEQLIAAIGLSLIHI